MPRKRGSLPARPAAKLPRLDQRLADQIEQVIAVDNPKKPPVKKARWLALMVQLDEMRQPYPTHPAVAAHIGCTKDHVEATANDMLTRDWVTMEVHVVPGNIQQRASVIQQRFYRPTAKLLRALPMRATG